ncbi:DUF4189 domain-containing protein [Eikenella sp. NML120348]|uniref:DUF4189 domain-containing protein n=1 Tax=Eikenella sp. NML120348 TaxID=1795831 RepID=UPI0007E120BB|nr:DUF4189 domain-containing protein [Eikenella sp. NML120348]OAM40096.1 hypothetical protein A7P99_02610 [Eikenella sp. NML120348]
MKQTMMNTAAGVLAAVLLGSAGLAWADGFDPWLADGLNKQIQQNREAQQQPTYHGPTAAEIRAWQQREAEVQARIAHFRATPYWMAIGWDPVNKGLLWPGGYRSEQRAIEAVQQNCRSSRCEILATFANSCAVLVMATERPQSRRDIFVGIDRDDRRAAVKARQACTAARGEGDDRCFYSEIKTGKGAEGTAFCVGYDHSVYGQE